MYATGQTRSSLSMVEEVLNGVNSSEMEKLESDVEEIFNCTINNPIKMDHTSRISDPPGNSNLGKFFQGTNSTNFCSLPVIRAQQDGSDD